MGVVYGCRLFGRAMVERGEGGQIVNTASAAAFAPSRVLPAYSTTKAAVLMLSECLRAELVPYGDRCDGRLPRSHRDQHHPRTRNGSVATPISRSGSATYATERYRRRNFTPERVAAEIVEAIGADRAVVAITPEAKLVQALSRFAPGVLRRLAQVEATPV